MSTHTFEPRAHGAALKQARFGTERTPARRAIGRRGLLRRAAADLESEGRRSCSCSRSHIGATTSSSCAPPGRTFAQRRRRVSLTPRASATRSEGTPNARGSTPAGFSVVRAPISACTVAPVTGGTGAPLCGQDGDVDADAPAVHRLDGPVDRPRGSRMAAFRGSGCGGTTSPRGRRTCRGGG